MIVIIGKYHVYFAGANKQKVVCVDDNGYLARCNVSRNLLDESVYGLNMIFNLHKNGKTLTLP